MTNYETPRLAKQQAWNAGAEAFADFVQKATQEIINACEQNEVANVDPPSWLDVAQRFARAGAYICQEGLVATVDHNPFVLREFTDADTRRLLRVVGGPPPRTKAELSLATARSTTGSATNNRGRQKPAAPGKGASDDPA